MRLWTEPLIPQAEDNARGSSPSSWYHYTSTTRYYWLVVYEWFVHGGKQMRCRAIDSEHAEGGQFLRHALFSEDFLEIEILRMQVRVCQSKDNSQKPTFWSVIGFRLAMRLSVQMVIPKAEKHLLEVIHDPRQICPDDRYVQM